jgi:hypothetical protein
MMDNGPKKCKSEDSLHIEETIVDCIQNSSINIVSIVLGPFYPSSFKMGFIYIG